MARTVRQRFALVAPELVSSSDIARAIGVGVSAVSNYAARWADFPAPLWTIGTASIYPRDEIADCLDRHGVTHGLRT